MNFLNWFQNNKTQLLTVLLVANFVSIDVANAINPEECDGIDKRRFKVEYQACLRVEIAGDLGGGVDCIECLFAQEEESNPWVDALGHIAGPLAFFGAAYMGAKYQHKSQAAWAGAYQTGHDACTNRFDSYLNYNIERGSNPILPGQAESFAGTCNGAGMGGF
ncbi:MAG: hypothetical protein HN576_06960, partial [Bacteriovoracaceae bacterium]|nr:hypothetical protein [Bacteriovoracaceae bacterium]